MRTGRVALGAAVALGALAGGRLVSRGPLWSLAGRVVLVTGGSRGLGLAVARELGRQRARVAICARDADTLERARVELEQRLASLDARTRAMITVS